MREIKYIVLHCTAGPQNQPTAEILNYWKKQLGWKNPGYHFEISADGSIEQLWPIEKIANGVAGHNAYALHISYKGGVDGQGNPIDNRTPAQKNSQIMLLKKYKKEFPKALVLGHRDFQGVNKFCPSFDVEQWLKKVNL